MKRRAFTLLELLVVITVMITLTAVSLPAVRALSGSIGRQGATDNVLLAFEQARITALSHGVRAYVGFADDSLLPQGAEFPYHAYIIFRDRTDDDPADAQFVPVTKWLFLPKQISFQRDCPLLLSAAPLAVTGLPRLAGNASLPVIAYSPTGNIETSGDLRLYFDENAKTATPDYINLRRFTGRAELISAK